MPPCAESRSLDRKGPDPLLTRDSDNTKCWFAGILKPSDGLEHVDPFLTMGPSDRTQESCCPTAPVLTVRGAVKRSGIATWTKWPVPGHATSCPSGSSRRNSARPERGSSRISGWASGEREGRGCSSLEQHCCRKRMRRFALAIYSPRPSLTGYRDCGNSDTYDPSVKGRASGRYRRGGPPRSRTTVDCRDAANAPLVATKPATQYPNSSKPEAG
jgi:hypothetical protein